MADHRVQVDHRADGPGSRETTAEDVFALYAPLLAGLRSAGHVDQQLSMLVDEAVGVWSRPGFDTFLSVPALRFTPFDYQLQAARSALRRMRGRAILADEVGLGKTIEAGLILAELRLRGLADRTLVICPAGLVTQWQEELERKFGVPTVLASRAAGHGTAGPGITGPGITGPDATGPDTAGPGSAGPGKAGPGDAGPGNAGAGGADRPGRGRRLAVGQVAVVKGQLTVLQVAADQQVMTGRGGAQPRPGVPALPFGSGPGRADLPAAAAQPGSGLLAGQRDPAGQGEAEAGRDPKHVGLVMVVQELALLPHVVGQVFFGGIGIARMRRH